MTSDTFMNNLQTKLASLTDEWVHAGGIAERKAPLAARYNFESVDSESVQKYQQEIEDALAHEISAELTERLYSSARAQATQVAILTANGISDMTASSIRLHDIANTLDGRCSIIMSPTMLTCLQASEGGIFKPSTPKAFGCVGHFGNHKVFIDPYACDVTPTLVCAPGWFSFKSGLIAYHGPVMIDPNTYEPTMPFYDDVSFKLDAQKIKSVGLDVLSLRFT